MKDHFLSEADVAEVARSIEKLDDTIGDAGLCNVSSNHCCASKAAPLGTSIATMVYADESPILESIQTRLEDTFGLRRANAGTWQHLFYSAENEAVYKQHTDCVGGGGRNRRAFTVLLYLNDADGGETVFPEVHLTIQPRRGRVVVFRSVDEEGACMNKSAHMAAKLNSGSKSLIMMWYMAHPLPTARLHTDIMPAHVKQPTLRQAHILCDGSNSCREYRRYLWTMDWLPEAFKASYRALRPCDTPNTTINQSVCTP